jgi:hypothetical protein
MLLMQSMLVVLIQQEKFESLNLDIVEEEQMIRHTKELKVTFLVRINIIGLMNIVPSFCGISLTV